MSKTSKSMYFICLEGKYFRTQIGFNTFIKEATSVFHNQSSDQDSSLEDEKAKKEDRPSSSHLSTRSVTIQTQQNLAMTYSSREKYTISVSGKLVRTPSDGSILPEHKTDDYRSGKSDPMPLLYTVLSVLEVFNYKAISQKKDFI